MRCAAVQKKLGEMRGTMMPGAGTQQAPTMTERLDLQEKRLLARLESCAALSPDAIASSTQWAT